LHQVSPEDIARCVEAIRARTPAVPRVALNLGSGLGGFADTLATSAAVDYHDLPGFPVATVEGHAGRLVIGQTAGVPVVAQQGRFHLYEGYSAAQVTFPLRVMHALGARVLVVTNAAGGVDPRLNPGDLMLIEDLVNFQFRSPLRGRGLIVDSNRFVDMAEPFSKRLLAIGFEARRNGGSADCGPAPTGETSAPPMRRGPRSRWRAGWVEMPWVCPPCPRSSLRGTSAWRSWG
jgi:purine-nucleoside phosphorylase